MKTALLIEDHIESQQWMEEVLRTAFPLVVIDLADSIAGARSLLESRQYSIALVDINLPDGIGTDLVPSMIASNQVGYVVMSTIFDDDNHLFEAIQAGAHGYLLKDQPKDQLIEKLAGITRGDPPLSPGIARRLLSFYRKQSEAKPAKVEHKLSKREEEIITLIAKGVTTKEAASMLNITNNTAAGYVKSAYRKLDITSRAEASLKAVELGFVNSTAQ